MNTRKYIVRPGDSLATIAKRELGAAHLWPQLFAFNAGPRARFRPLHDPNHLSVGQALAIPPRIGSRPPFLPRHADLRHPFQRTHPLIPPVTAPAVMSAGPAALAPSSGRAAAPASRFSPAAAKSPFDVAATMVNSPAIKWDLDVAPPVKGSTPAFDYEIKYAGQIIMWVDEQVNLLTFTNKGLETEAKSKLTDTLVYLLTSEKIQFDPVSKKLSFESLLTAGVGDRLVEVQVGTVMDSSDPRPAFRSKLVSAFKLMGRVFPNTLWVAEKLQITVDVRAKASDPTARPQLAVPPVVAPPDRAAVAIPPVIAGPEVATSQPPAWTKSSWAPLFAALIFVGVLATNALTWGVRGATILPSGAGGFGLRGDKGA